MEAFNRVLFLLFFSLAAPALGQADVSPDDPIHHLREIVGPYPALGSKASDRDFVILQHYQDTRTEAECAAAAREEKATVRNFFAGPGGPLTVKEARHFSWLMKRGLIAAVVDHVIAKSIYKRPRPFLTHGELKPCIKIPKNYAYPSGHSTLARVWARILAKKYPERAEAILARGNEVGKNRVLGGVHHPSDIEAGKRLGDAIARKLLGEDR